MHSVYQRVNQLFAILSTYVLGLVAVVALSSFLFTADPKGTLAVGSLKVLPGTNQHFRATRGEFAFLKFELDADLTPLFHWNTKQLFLYLGAEYTSADGTRNDVILWDRIVRRKEDAALHVKGKNKYVFRDIATTFKNVTSAHYTLKYNVMPHVGFLTYGEAARTKEPVPFPPAQSRVS